MTVSPSTDAAPLSHTVGQSAGVNLSWCTTTEGTHDTRAGGMHASNR